MIVYFLEELVRSRTYAVVLLITNNKKSCYNHWHPKKWFCHILSFLHSLCFCKYVKCIWIVVSCDGDQKPNQKILCVSTFHFNSFPNYILIKSLRHISRFHVCSKYIELKKMIIINKYYGTMIIKSKIFSDKVFIMEKLWTTSS